MRASKEAERKYQREYKARERAANPEKARARARAQRAKDVEKARAKDRARQPRKTETMREWRKRNPGKIAEYRMRASYGIEPGDVLAMAQRQHGRCACCGVDFTDKVKPFVDHCHRTGKVRGLLCSGCNAALGFAKENLATLAQMRAYLELDRSRPVVYLIGSLRNPAVVEIGNEIRALGLTCIDNWFAAGPVADDSWQAYSNATGKTYREALQSREATNVFHFDKAYIELSDAVVLLYPAGKSGHLELGYAVGRGKRGYILQEEVAERYDVMLQFAQAPLFHTKPDLLVALREELLGGKV